MKIKVNGESVEWETKDRTVSGLVAHLNLEKASVAVALNMEFVNRSAYKSTELREGDEIEIVGPIQGGAYVEDR